MIVVAVAPLYPPWSLVGAWLATHELLRELHDRGHRVTVYRRFAASFVFVHEGIEVFPGRDDEPVVAAIGEADVVVSHLGDDGFAHRTAVELGKPTIRLIHSVPANAHELLADCTLAVFNSEATRLECGWAGPQIVIHPPPRTVNASAGPLVTLVNLAFEKGGELFERLAVRRPDIGFLGVKGGWGMQLPDLVPSNYAKPNVEIIEATKTISDIYRRTRILLMPSVRETWGMAGVEAMSCGIPVIAHPTPGLVEALGPAGIFADRDNESEWVDALDRLTDPAEWDLASKRARARADELTAERSAARFADTVEAVLVAA